MAVGMIVKADVHETMNECMSRLVRLNVVPEELPLKCDFCDTPAEHNLLMPCGHATLLCDEHFDEHTMEVDD